jgi:hypothetical protein
LKLSGLKLFALKLFGLTAVLRVLATAAAIVVGTALDGAIQIDGVARINRILPAAVIKGQPPSADEILQRPEVSIAFFDGKNREVA